MPNEREMNGIGQRNDAITWNDGSIVILRPLTPAAQEWCDEHIPDAIPWGADCLAIEYNYAGPILDGMRADGLTVR